MAKFWKKLTLKNVAKAVGLKGIKPMLQTNADILTGVTGADPLIKATKKLLNPKDETAPVAAPLPAIPDLPVTEKELAPIQMPTMDSAAIEAERRKALIRALSRGGRASTILSQPQY